MIRTLQFDSRCICFGREDGVHGCEEWVFFFLEKNSFKAVRLVEETSLNSGRNFDG